MAISGKIFFKLPTFKFCYPSAVSVKVFDDHITAKMVAPWSETLRLPRIVGHSWFRQYPTSSLGVFLQLVDALVLQGQQPMQVLKIESDRELLGLFLEVVGVFCEKSIR